MKNKWVDDTDYRTEIVKEATEFDKGWELSFGVGCLWIPKNDKVVPKKGSVCRLYGDGLGRPIRGVMIDGEMNHYITKEEENEKHRKWVDDTKKEYWKSYKKLMKDIKDDEPFITANITGFGGAYERAAQMGLQAGIDWLKDHPGFKFSYEQCPNIIGVCKTNDMGDLEDVLLKAMNDDMTGAQHQCLINHLHYIHENGYDKWLDEMGDRKYEYPKELPIPSFCKDT